MSRFLGLFNIIVVQTKKTKSLIKSCWSISELFGGSNLRFFTFNGQHMKLKAKSIMKSSFPGRGMAWWDRLR